MLGNLINAILGGGKKASLAEEARALRLSGDWAAALQANRINPMGAEVVQLAVRDAAQLALEQGQDEPARSFLEKEARASPMDYEIQANLSAGKRRFGDVDGALENAHLAVKLADGKAEPVYNLALLLHEIGEFSDAEKYYRQCIRDVPRICPRSAS